MWVFMPQAHHADRVMRREQTEFLRPASLAGSFTATLHGAEEDADPQTKDKQVEDHLHGD